ncbi:hypothetical protein FOPG_01993 [Fusarium oxysporum f. sp. conglutinans race 2 54008]|uniref:Uncharacterized protein n=5 Tax=Fusarium oxysporum TaxID=5507 RepID=A0A420PNN6_FUSOX|nr:hypothetical protein FOWG_05001 [Fusarium oxysporum f. sp. lycopersici MN25]EXL86402.1 hypothetical protein FOPG_01993 [Fusarium oxysporum f. sp. conglutinans race 2 54008]EXM30930.1 hypothetical protein FOTG_03838 [Fusarium oxysporum f. sp. vasinfectum 25433]KAH7476111.1 hypothetical protein FOMA001_g11084 [Fusarium oxysporum f. sp. matthiolae]RKK15359.1 hypothetical protein BFJ65_g11897 [Fusarium oxysporum f. sp. cepae]RKK85530.1 hypothetical protein BFJ71_g14178 [Fusarium oxysporum]RYC9
MPNSIFGAWQAKLKKRIPPQPQHPLPFPELVKPHNKISS